MNEIKPPAPDAPQTVLEIKLSDLWRTALADNCDNEGFIGVAPDGSQYHVVTPVDRKRARGLDFFSGPTDGTPFGGYKGWSYFCCPAYPAQGSDEEAERRVRLDQARENGQLLRAWGAAHGLVVRLVDDFSRPAPSRPGDAAGEL